MEKQNKLTISFLLATLLSLTFVIAATGTVSLDLPTDGSSNSGTFVLNVTNSSFDEMNNCTFTIASSSTANTSVSIGTFANDTLDNVNATFDSTTIEDSDDYLLTASCRNSSNDQATDTATITIDNTAPATPTSLSPATATIDTDGSVVFSGTVVGANTTGCTLVFSGLNPGSTSYAMTHTGNTCTYTHSSVPEQTYSWYITASDGTNSSSASAITLQVDVPNGGGTTTTNETQTTTQKDYTFLIVAVFVILVIWFVIKRK